MESRRHLRAARREPRTGSRETRAALAARAEQALGWARGTAGDVARRAALARRAQGARRSAIACASSVARRRGAAAPRAADESACRGALARGHVRLRASSSSARGRPAPGRRCGWPRPASPSTIVERGKPVQPRRHDLAPLTRGRARPDSNYCFGEGGAGTYSDGKLYTRAKDRAAVARACSPISCASARPPRSQVDARPHVGSNRLPKVLTALRAHLERAGVDVPLRDARWPACAPSAGACARVRCAGGDEVDGRRGRARGRALGAADLRVGGARRHRARAQGASRSGVRIEHPQPLIDASSTARAAGHPRLPPAFYELRDRGGRARRLQLLHVPGRLDCPGRHRARRRRRQRHEPVAARLAVRQLRARGRRRAAHDFGPAATGRWRASSSSAASSARAFAAGGGALSRAGAAPRRLPGAAPERRGRCRVELPARPRRRPISRGVLPPFVVDGAARRAARASARDARLPRAATRSSSASRRAPARPCASCAIPRRSTSPSLARPLSRRRRRGLRGRHRQRRDRRRAHRRADPRGGFGAMYAACVQAAGVEAGCRRAPSTCRSQALLLVGDHLEADAGRVVAVVGLADPGDARLDPQAAASRSRRRRRPGTARARPPRPRRAARSASRPAPPSDRSRVVAVKTERDVRISADMRMSRRACCRRRCGHRRAGGGRCGASKGVVVSTWCSSLGRLGPERDRRDRRLSVGVLVVATARRASRRGRRGTCEVARALAVQRRRTSRRSGTSRTAPCTRPRVRRRCSGSERPPARERQHQLDLDAPSQRDRLRRDQAEARARDVARARGELAVASTTPRPGGRRDSAGTGGRRARYGHGGAGGGRAAGRGRRTQEGAPRQGVELGLELLDARFAPQVRSHIVAIGR